MGYKFPSGVEFDGMENNLKVLGLLVREREITLEDDLEGKEEEDKKEEVEGSGSEEGSDNEDSNGTPSENPINDSPKSIIEENLKSE